MPTYDYECKKCHHKFEHFQSMTDDLLTICPKCKGELRRLIGGGLGVIFKGSGFYVNDAKSATNPAGAPLTPKKNSASSTNKNTATQAKPETKSSSSGSDTSKSSRSSETKTSTNPS